MKKYIGTVEKNLVDRLMDISKRLDVLIDLKATILDLQAGNRQDIDISGIDLEEIEKKIGKLSAERLDKYEEIRVKQGWTKDFLAGVSIKENYKVYHVD